MEDLNRKRKDLDTPETPLVGVESGPMVIKVERKFIWDTRKSKGWKEEDVTNTIHNVLVNIFKKYCEDNNWFPTGDGPDYFINEQRWVDLSEQERYYYTRAGVPRKYAKVYRIWGKVIPKGTNAAPIPTDQVHLDTNPGNYGRQTETGPNKS